MANFKIALTAGHYLGTPGKRCRQSLDPKQTKEWVLNDRIADKVEKLLQQYTGWELLRTDDTTGQKNISLDTRTAAANKFGADFYLSIHHNAGVNGGKGGGIMAYVHTHANPEELAWQKALYTALIEATGLKGNRSTPMARANLHECREPKAPAVLLELGFMDSSTDVPVILSETFADQCAAAIVRVLAERGKLQKKTEQAPQPQPETKPAETFQPYLIRTTCSALNIRAGAGTDYKVTGCIRDKLKYTIVSEADGKGAKKWGELLSGAGWIALDYTRRV